MFEKNENKQKEAGLAHLKKYYKSFFTFTARRLLGCRGQGNTQVDAGDQIFFSFLKNFKIKINVLRHAQWILKYK